MSSAQNENKKLGFFIQKPKGWNSTSKDDVLQNLSKFDITEEKLSEILENNKNSVLIASYMKYNPKEYPGLIPTIQVNLRKNTSKDYNGFKVLMNNSIEQFKKVFANFKVTSGPHDIEIDGHKTFMFTSTFDMLTQSGMKFSVRSWTYGIYNGTHFYQLNFSDEVNGPDDCKALFEETVKEIKIN